MTTGAPMSEVIALMGRVMGKPGNWAKISQSNISNAPPRIQAGRSVQ